MKNKLTTKLLALFVLIGFSPLYGIIDNPPGNQNPDLDADDIELCVEVQSDGWNMTRLQLYSQAFIVAQLSRIPQPKNEWQYTHFDLCESGLDENGHQAYYDSNPCLFTGEVGEYKRILVGYMRFIREDAEEGTNAVQNSGAYTTIYKLVYSVFEP